jgi:hypothetical protein
MITGLQVGLTNRFRNGFVKRTSEVAGLESAQLEFLLEFAAEKPQRLKHELQITEGRVDYATVISSLR